MHSDIIEPPLPHNINRWYKDARKVLIENAPSIASLPKIDPIADRIEALVALRVRTRILLYIPALPINPNRLRLRMLRRISSTSMI